MNSTQNDGDKPASLEADLDELSRGYSRLPKDGPAESLDRSVVDSAHRAVGTTARRMKFTWVHGLTTTMLFVLVLSVIYLQLPQTPLDDTGLLNTGPNAARSTRSAVEIPPVLRTAPAAAGVENGPDETRNAADETIVGTNGDRASALREEAVVDPDRVSASPGTTAQSRRGSATGVAVMAAKLAESKNRQGTDVETQQLTPERRLQDILEMRQLGEDSWIYELQSFVEDYPDFPLPDELAE